MKHPRPIFRRRRRGELVPTRPPTADDLLALLGEGWHRLKARPGFADRVVLAARRTGSGPGTAAARDRPRRLRAGVLAGAASAFLLAFAAGLIEAGRGGVQSAADGPGRHGAVRPPAVAPLAVPDPGGLEAPQVVESLAGPDPDAPHPLDALPWLHRTSADPASPAGRERP